MSKWTRRDLVKVGLAAGAAALTPRDSKGSQPSGGAPFHPMEGQDAGEAAPAPDGLRDRLLMDFGWKFALGHADDPAKDFGFGMLRREGTFAKAGRVDGPAAPKFSDAAWRAIDLPHDWAVELPFVNEGPLPEHGGKPLGREYPATSVGWYRRTFDIPAADAGKRICLEFDGIFRNATVFLNGHYLAENMSGYAPLAVDVTDFISYGDAKGSGRNVLAVRVDASLDEGWFYEGAGIYRHVWLTRTAPVHIARWGNYVRAEIKGVSANSAAPASQVFVSTEVMNESEAAFEGRTRTALVDPAGKTVATAVSAVSTIPAGASFTFKADALVGRSELWSLKTPHLYRAVTTLEAGGKAVDGETSTFGIRSLRFDADRGFLLNGKPVKIKGTCNHQDHAGLGAALPDRMQAYRIERLQAMGCNAYRTSHNPPTAELLDACDRMGMMVMDETRMMSSNREGLSELERLIKRDRNHPSVIIWSLGNEEPEQATARGARIVGSMKRLQRKLDPSRVSTVAMNNGWGGIGISNVLDVQGCNYRTGFIDKYHQEHPAQPMIGTETASTLATRGIYANDKERGYMSAYDVNKPSWGETAEEWWSFYAEREWLAGGFAWTGFDYRGEPTPYHWPCISSHFGIMDTCGFPKDDFHYYRAWWGSEPALHVFPHWNWAGKEGQEVEVWAFSNQESVELFVNGASAGSQAVKRNGHLVWKVKYAPGTIEARASKGGAVVLTEKRETAGAAVRLIAKLDRATIAADGEDVAVVTVMVADAMGREAPLAGNMVTFGVSGPGSVIGVGNGDPSCHEPDKAVQRSAFNGWCMAVVQGKRGAAGRMQIRCDSAGLEPATLELNSVAGALRPSIG